MQGRRVKNVKGSEKRSWKALNEQVPEQNFSRIESRTTGSGIPDVWGGDCAVELKCSKNLPVGVMTPVCLDHKLSIPQSRWLNARWRHGFKAFVLVQIGQANWFLFAAPDSWCLVHGREVPIVKFKLQALWWSPAGIDKVSSMVPFIAINDWFRKSFHEIECLRRDAELNERVIRI